MADTPPGFTPVTLITGFLGSGKTTPLQRLLLDPALSDTAVLINEFGEIGLDHHLLERIDETMVMLQSGCVCCTIRGELSTAIKDLHSRRERGLVPPFRRLVIESTGLADPFPILSTGTASSNCCRTRLPDIARSRPTAGQAAAAFVRMKAICRSLNLNFRIETSRPRDKA